MGNGTGGAGTGNGNRKLKITISLARVMDGWAVDSDLSSVDELRSSRD